MKVRHLVFPPTEGRHHPGHIFWSGKRKQLGLSIVGAFVLLQLLFLCNMSYLFGSMYKQSNREHRINILMVNYDDGALAASLRDAVKSSQSTHFPSVLERPPTDYQDISSLVHAVHTGQYWGAIYTHQGASDRLAAALLGGEAAASYDPSDAISYVWNEARYSATAEAVVDANLQKLIAATTSVYYATNGVAALHTVNSTDPAAAKALYHPIQPSSYNIKPTSQAVRVVYGALPMVFTILMQFFFLMAINGISSHLQLYSHLSIPANWVARLLLSLFHTFIGSLCFAGVIRAFEEDWGMSTGQFFLTWMIFWLDMHINFCVIDVATTVLPMQFFSFFVLSWVILNIASTLTPFELVPGFYRWSYALPAHETFTILLQIWSGGADDHLHRALPILFAWQVVAGLGAYMALNYRCTITRKAIEDEEVIKKVDDDNMSTITGVTITGATLTLQALGRSRREREHEDQERIQSQYEPYFPDTLMPMGGMRRGHGSL